MEGYTSLIINTNNAVTGSMVGFNIPSTLGYLEIGKKYTLQFKIRALSTSYILDNIYIGSQKIDNVDIRTYTDVDVSGNVFKLCHVTFVSACDVIKPNLKICKGMSSEDTKNTDIFEVTDVSLSVGDMSQYDVNVGDFKLLRREFNTKIQQLSDEIKLSANSDTIDKLTGDISKALGQIQVNAGEISLRTEKDNIITDINLSNEGVKIRADRMELAGVSRDLCQLVPHKNLTGAGSTANWSTSGTPSTGEWWSNGMYFPFTDAYMPNVFSMYEPITIEFEAYPSTANQWIDPRVWFFDNNGAILGTCSGGGATLKSGWNKYTVNIEFEQSFVTKGASCFIGAIINNTKVWMRNVSIRKKINSALIVDGAIRAQHILSSEFLKIFNTAGVAELTSTSLNFRYPNGNKYMSMENGRFNVFMGGKYLGGIVGTRIGTSNISGVSMFGSYNSWYMDFGVDYSTTDPSQDFSFNPLMRLVYSSIADAYPNQSEKAEYGRPGVHFYREPISYHTGQYLNNNTIYLNKTYWDSIFSTPSGMVIGTEGRPLFLGRVANNNGVITGYTFLQITPAGADNGSGGTSSTGGMDAYVWLDMHGRDIWNTQIKTSSDLSLKQDIRYLADNNNRATKEITEMGIYESFKRDMNFAEYKYKSDVDEYGIYNAQTKVGIIADDLVGTEIGDIILDVDESTDLLAYDNNNYTNILAITLLQEINMRDAQIRSLEERLNVVERGGIYKKIKDCIRHIIK